MADMGGQIDKMVSFIHFEAKNKKEEILAKAKQDKEAKKLELVHREKLKTGACGKRLGQKTTTKVFRIMHGAHGCRGLGLKLGGGSEEK